MTARDWKHQIPQHDSAAESPQGSNDPTRGIREDIRKLNISSDIDAPKPSIKNDKKVNSHSDPVLERNIFGGRTYEEFDKRFRYLKSTSSDLSKKEELSSSSNYINFEAFPDSETWNTVYLPRLSTKEHFNEWVECLIGQMKLAGLERFIPNKKNNWSSDVMDNMELSNTIAFMWKECIPKNCCPDWVDFTPYDSEDSSITAVFELLTEYNRRKKNREIWREAINQIKGDMVSSDPRILWKEGTKVYRNSFDRKRYRDADLILDCLQQMIVENYATKCDKLREELEKNNDIDILTALKLIRIEAKKYVKPKRTNKGEEYKGKKPYERSKKNSSNARNN